jgi:hypothetical protein
MPLVIPANMGVLTVTGIGGTGDVWANVFAIDCTLGGGPAADIVPITGAFNTFYNALAGSGYLPTGWVLQNYNLKENVAGGIGSADLSAAITPGGGFTPLPPQLAIVVSWKTALVGRSYRGRTYLGPLPTGIVSATGTIAPAVQAGVQADATNLRTNLATASFPLSVWSRVHNNFQHVTGNHVGPYVDTQRRRRSLLHG